MTNTKTTRTRPMAREPEASTNTEATKPKPPSRLDQLQEQLLREEGASIAEMVETTGWQQHSVRGAMAGSLKKRGLVITSEKVDGTRRYSATMQA